MEYYVYIRGSLCGSGGAVIGGGLLVKCDT